MSSVQSVERAFMILGCLSSGTTKVTEIGERIGLPKSTVSRLISTMAAIGIVEQAPDSSEYLLGSGFYSLASSGVFDASVLTIAKPYLIDLASSLGEATGLAIRDDTEVLYLYDGAAESEIQIRDWTGERAPMHLVPSGLAILAYCDDSFIDDYLARPLEFTTERSTTDGQTIKRRLSAIRRNGYELLRGEFTDEVSSVSAPIRNSSGEVVAAIFVHGPSFRFLVNQSSEVANVVMEAAKKISGQLGWVD